MQNQPFISVIVPVYNGSKYLNQCLDALIDSSYPAFEIIVVDDASTDNSIEICRKKGINVFQMPKKSGPAATRNYGTTIARGEILLFVDSDVLVKEETISRVSTNFMNNPDIAAVFGSYDDSPESPNFLSQFRNLLHHFIHQNSHQNAKTFWSGCGAVNREIFLQLKGYDEGWFSIEDIELGYRIHKHGYRIMLDKELQVKHLKHWGWNNWLKTDIFYRAVPWSKLILSTGHFPGDLNLQTLHIISAFLVDLLILTIPLSFLDTKYYFGIALNDIFIFLSLLLIVTVIILNRGLYSFFLRRKGVRFMILAIPVHFFYYFYSSLTFTVCWVQGRLKKLHLAF